MAADRRQRAASTFAGRSCGRRRGQSVIYWPALLQTVLVMVGVCVALQLPMAVLFGGKYHPGVFATLVVGGLALLAASIYRGLRTSLDQLTPLDEGKGATGYASASPSAVDDAAEHAREQVRGPAIGLLVTGILNWVALTAAAIFMGWMAFGTKGQPSYTVLIVLPFAFVCSVLMILAALKMKRLDGYWLAVTASVLAIVISPSNLIGLPIGVWALVVLSQADVRTAFRRNRKRATKDRQGRMLGVRLIDVRDGRRVVYWPGVWLVAAVLVIGGLIAVVASICCSPWRSPSLDRNIEGGQVRSCSCADVFLSSCSYSAGRSASSCCWSGSAMAWPGGRRRNTLTRRLRAVATPTAHMRPRR